MSTSRLSLDQREQVVALFEQGHGYKAAARLLGLPTQSVSKLYKRWRVVGQAVLVTRSSKRQYDADLKRQVVERFLAGESQIALAREYDLSSAKLIGKWAAIYREHGPQGLQPARRGRPPAVPDEVLDEVSRLRRENERLRAQVAYLGKVRALKAPGRD